MNAVERIVKQLKGEEIDRIPCYSGMGNVTTAGLDKYGYKFSQVHGDAEKMANAAASSNLLFGYECATVPFDLCVEAEALGCQMNAYDEVAQLLYPTIKSKIIENPIEQLAGFKLNLDNLATKGRVPVVCEAIKMMKANLGTEAAVGAYILGPYTLAGQIMALDDLFKLTFKKSDDVNALLDQLADALIIIAKAYAEAGADFICVREMGATSDILSPRSFKKVIEPHLVKIFEALKDIPNILHICGSTNKVVKQMADCKAMAIAIEAKNDMALTREDIGYEPLVFGAIDSFNVLVNGTPEEVKAATLKCLDDSVDALWPSCDIWPDAPVENLKAMVDTVAEFGASRWVRKNK